MYLNEPNTEIEHDSGGNEYLRFAAGSMQGWRLNMVSFKTSVSDLYFRSVFMDDEFHTPHIFPGNNALRKPFCQLEFKLIS